MSPKIGDSFSVKSYVPEFRGRCFPAKGYVPIFGDAFFGKALCPRILLIDSTDGATLLSKVLVQTN